MGRCALILCLAAQLAVLPTTSAWAGTGAARKQAARKQVAPAKKDSKNSERKASEKPAAAVSAEQRREDQDWGRAKTIKGGEAPGYVTFTFDDGPNPDTTPEVIAVLEEFGVPGAFFVVGRRYHASNPRADEGIALLKSMQERGYLVGNHTTAHAKLRAQSFKDAQAAIADNASALEPILGFRPRLFRPPFGASTRKIDVFLAERGDTVVRWNVDSLDYQKQRRKTLRARTSAAIFQKGGGVVLMHDTKPWTAEALRGVLQDLQNENCRRLRAKESLIVPVSLHYFMTEADGSARAIPLEVMRTTQKTLFRIVRSCQKGD